MTRPQPAERVLVVSRLLVVPGGRRVQSAAAFDLRARADGGSRANARSGMAAHVDSGAAARSEPIFVTPNEEAAHAWKVPPRTLETLARHRLEDGYGAGPMRVASPLRARRALLAALRRVEHVSDVRGFASAAEGTLRELMRGGERFVREHHDDPRVERLAAVIRAWRNELEAAGLVHDADVVWRAAGMTRREAGRPWIVVGYPRLPLAERIFLHRHAGPGSEVHLPTGVDPMFEENRGAVEDFREHGWRIVDADSEEVLSSGPDEEATVGRRLASAWLGGPHSRGRERASGATELPPGVAHEPQVHATAYPDRDAEIRGVLAQVKQRLMQGVPADAIALIARHERAYGARVRAVAAEYGVPVRVPYAVPLRETRVGAWIAAGVDARANGLPFEATARWLADPVVDPATLPGGWWSRARRSKPEGIERWASAVPELAEPSWPQRADRRAWVELVIDMVRRFGVAHGSARWPREAATLHALDDAFAEWTGLVEAEDELELDRFLAELHDLLATLSVPEQARRGGVALHTPLSVFGARFESVFVLGTAEGDLPAPVRPDPFLDPFDRARLRDRFGWLEDVRAQARREEMSFWAMLQCADRELHLGYPTLAGRSEQLPSPYLARLGLKPVAAGTPAVASRREFRRAFLATGHPDHDDPLLPVAAHARDVELQREVAAERGPFDGETGIPWTPPPRGVGVTRLIEMASCPFKFWSRSVLGLRELEEAPTTLEPHHRGLLYHETLHRALEHARHAGEAEEVREAALAALDGAFREAEEALREAYGVDVDAFPNWNRDRRDHLRTLQRAVRSEAFLRPGERILTLEAPFEGSWRGIGVRGRVDRVDAGPDRVALIDYKSGGSVGAKAKDASGRASLDLQLPVYRAASEALLQELLPEGVPDERAIRYVSISKADAIRSSEPGEDEQERVAREVARAWAQGAFPVDPDVDFAACEYCAFDSVCRRGPRLERKRSA